MNKIIEKITKDIYMVEIIGDYYKYKEKAKELGYKEGSISLERKEVIVLYPCKVFNILSKSIFGVYKIYNTLSSEDFFALKNNNRKEIDKDILSVLVYNLCDKCDSFSAYDITSTLRKMTPSHEIVHNEVRDIVNQYVLENKLNSNYMKDRGYILYSKNKNNNNIVTKGVVSVGGGVGGSSYTMTNHINKIEKKLQQDARINLNKILNTYFPNFDKFYLTKANNVIRVSIVQSSNEDKPLSKSQEIRINTGFKSNKVILEITDRSITIREK